MDTHSFQNFQLRISGLEQRVEKIETDMAEINSNLVGTLEKPGTLELLRRTNDQAMSINKKVDGLSERVESLFTILSTRVESLFEHKWTLLGMITGACSVIGICIGLVIKFVK